MKVGVHLADAELAEGGAHTFENEIIRALSTLIEESRHTFVIFTQRPEVVKPLLNTGLIQVVALPQPSFQSLLKEDLLRVTIKISRRIGRCFYQRMSSFDKMARSLGVQIVWFPTPSSVAVALPYVTTVLDLQHRIQPYFPEVGESYEWASREALFSTSLRRAAFIIIGSETGKAEIERFYQIPAERIKVLPHPTPMFAFDTHEDDEEAVLNKYSIPKGYLFYPALFWSHKNHVNLLLAMQILQDKHGLILPIVFVGADKGNENYVRRVAFEIGISSSVYFLGFVPQSDLRALYRNAFGLTYVTFFGPDNLPPLEAFALGCPVIASEVSGATEQLGDSALFVDPKDPEDIAQAILSLHRDPRLRAELIRRGRERAIRWTTLEFVRGVFSILDEFEPIRRCWDS